jgi:hypothetical protein
MIRRMAQVKMSRPIVRTLRVLCLALPETSETASWGHPNFRAGKRTQIDFLLRKKNFFATPYGGDRWVSVWADGALDWRLVARLLECSYRIVANKRMITALDNAAASNFDASRSATARGESKRAAQ